MEYITAKTIISGYSEKSEWFDTNYNMNIYKGCCHGCIYCDSRSDCYRIEKFDTVRAKKDVIPMIANELRRKRKKGVIATGSMSDPYNPFEKELCLTRKALELVSAYSFGIAIATKSDLIVRDIDILQEIKEHSPVLCKITITTADDALARIIEPNVSSSSQRFKAVKELSDAGIFAGVLLMPVLPFITDSEENIKEIVRLAYENGAKFVFGGFGGFGMTLRSNQREHYFKKLAIHFPNLLEKYISNYSNSYSCGILNHKEKKKMFIAECKKYGLIYRMADIVKAYRKGYDEEIQTSLF